ncbi:MULTISPECIES: hypothetical protein [unclassified Bradyrhizobium]
MQNGAGLIEWTEEARFAAIVRLADAMKTKEILDLAKSLGVDMSSSWRDRAISIIDGVDALRALERVSWELLQSPTLEHELIEQLLRQAQVSCRSVELYFGCSHIGHPSLRIGVGFTEPNRRGLARSPEFGSIAVELPQTYTGTPA